MTFRKLFLTALTSLLAVSSPSLADNQPSQPRITTNDLSVFADDPRYNSLVGKTQIWDFTKDSLDINTLCNDDENCIAAPLPYLKSCEIIHRPSWADPIPQNSSEILCDTIRYWIEQSKTQDTDIVGKSPYIDMKITTFYGVPFITRTKIFDTHQNETRHIHNGIGPGMHTFLLSTPEHLFSMTIQKIYEATK